MGLKAVDGMSEGEHGDDDYCADDVVEDDEVKDCKDYDRGFDVVGSEEVGDDVVGNVVAVAHGHKVRGEGRNEAHGVGDGYDAGVVVVDDSCSNEAGVVAVAGVALRTETDDAAFADIDGSKAVGNGGSGNE